MTDGGRRRSVRGGRISELWDLCRRTICRGAKVAICKCWFRSELGRSQMHSGYMLDCESLIGKFMKVSAIFFIALSQFVGNCNSQQGARAGAQCTYVEVFV